jgi:cytochrome c-type biogenesis protein CcmH
MALGGLLAITDRRYRAERASNAAILREQLAEARAELASGQLAPAQFTQAQLEIERRALAEAAPAPAAIPGRSGWRAGALIGVALPLGAVALYSQIGRPDLILPQPASAAEVAALTERLATRLERQPDDPQSWRVLALAYYATQRFPESAHAYARLAQLVPDDPGVLADYADALAMAQGRRMAGEPLALAHRALELDPRQWKARALVASEAFQRKDYGAAIGHWEALRAAAPPDSPMAQTVAGYIDQARRLAAGSGSGAEN